MDQNIKTVGKEKDGDHLQGPCKIHFERCSPCVTDGKVKASPGMRSPFIVALLFFTPSFGVTDLTKRFKNPLRIRARCRYRHACNTRVNISARLHSTTDSGSRTRDVGR